MKQHTPILSDHYWVSRKDDLQHYWTKIISNPVTYNREATWSNTDIGNRKIFIKYWTTSVWRNRRKQSRRSYKKTRKFKIPRIEKIQNYCLNYSTSTRKYIAKQLDRILKGVSPIGSWFTTGQVILIPKN